MANTLQFDEQFYLQQNPDVAAAVSRGLVASGAQHYELYGRFEARNPNAFFDTSFYLGQYPDVAAAGVNPLAHFLTFGAAEGRFTNQTVETAIDTDGNGFANEFNASAYLNANPDVAAAVTSGIFKSAFQHFIEFGQFESRAGAPAGPFGNNGGQGGSGFALTTGIDTLTGTSGNDTFTANFAVNPSTGVANVPTLSALDTLNGGAGNDTLVVYTDGTALPAATINSIEKLDVISSAGVTADVSGTNIAGLTTLTARAAAGAVSLTTKANVTSATVTGTATTVAVTDSAAAGADKLASVSVSGNTGAVTVASDVLTSLSLTNTAQSATVTAAAATRALNVSLNNVTGGTITDATATTVNVSANGTASSGATLAAATASTVTLGGSAALSLSLGTLAANAAVTATNTAGVTIASTLANDVTFTGGAGADAVTLGATTKVISLGAGNDTVTATAAALGTGGSVSGGEGIDRLITNGTVVSSATDGAKFTGFEILQVTAGTVDLNNIGGITNVELNGSSTVSNLSAAQAGAVSIVGGGTYTVGLSGATTIGQLDALTVTVDDGLAAKNTITVGNLTAAGVETVNVVTNDNLVLSSATGLTGVTKLMFTGAGDVSVTTGALAINANTVVDASAHTGAFTFNASSATTNGLSITGSTTAVNTITGTAQADVITGGAGNDVLQGGAGSDTIVGGAGNDILAGETVTLTSGAVSAVGTHTAANILTGGDGNDTFAFGVAGSNVIIVDTIKDLNLGTNASAGGVDKLVFDLATAGTTTAPTVVALTAAQQTAVTGAASFSAALDAVINDIGTNANSVAQFTYGSDTYIVANGAANATAFDGTSSVVVKVTGIAGTLDASDIVIV
ncbi:hypothetical protein NS226_13730 [Aureimonas ureilytica]|uniref:Calcium-binding protein n=1 Tax=Aureimonas ureilytica TaxID=401562 RepID=A0A175R8T1_9HYPH|nr:calcium-binding protein [Aureimonas ureilytica]KTQ94986.1 hypothetical protein NS226_13730 [Aureimonas ureilytica]